VPQFVQIVSFCIALLLAPTAFAQSWPTDLTVVSVLTMAKDLAETEPAKGSRLLLKLRVAQAIKDTGREATFGGYVADVSSELERAIPPQILNAPDWQKNRELKAEAEALFLAGDLEGAERQLRQCQIIPHYDSCMRRDHALQLQFLHWELEAQDLPAALRRFGGNDWQRMEPTVALWVARAHIIAGRQSDVSDILSQFNNRLRAAAEQGALGAGAAIRHAVNTGDIMRAMQTALSRPRLADRVVGLTIIAEGLANLPGLPAEGLAR
jgi:hypothetical protein